MDIRWNAEKYPPLWRCIYCGETDRNKLTDEHIIPFGLLPKGGDWFLPKSSCIACAGLTAKFEGRCLGPMFGPLRQQIDLKSRRKSKKSKSLIARFNYRDGSLIDREIAINDFPFVCVGFRFRIPGIILGTPPTNRFEGERVVRYPTGSIEKTLRDGEAIRIAQISELDFAKMLAKIAHSYAIAKYGQDSFAPLLNDLILSRTDIAPYFVGGDIMEAPPDQAHLLHDVFRNDCRRDNGPPFLGVSIRLFACFGMPRYHVIVGRLLKEGPPGERRGDTIAVKLPIAGG